MLQRLKAYARHLKLEIVSLYLAARDPRTPRLVRFLVVVIVAYALSPVDLIPDFIPVLGLLDDLILLPMLIALAIRLTPTSVLEDCRVRSRREFQSGLPVNRVAVWVIVLIWLFVVGIVCWWLVRHFSLL